MAPGPSRNIGRAGPPPAKMISGSSCVGSGLKSMTRAALVTPVTHRSSSGSKADGTRFIFFSLARAYETPPPLGCYHYDMDRAGGVNENSPSGKEKCRPCGRHLHCFHIR